ncbi:MAG: DUF3127 domain-containing protein [Bacteroidota bacterium]
MELEGKVIEIIEPKTGESARGPWKKQEIILETEDAYPKKICMINWNDKVDISSLQTGQRVKAFINIESREYNGNWFTDVKIWKIETTDADITQPPAPENPSFTGGETPDSGWSASNNNEEGDPLPF